MHIQKFNNFIFEQYLPNDMSGYTVQDFIYHVTPDGNVQHILDYGFTPKNGTAINGQKFRNRLYFATSLIAAYDLSVNFDSIRRDIGSQTILKVSKSCLKDYKIDPLFGHGIYINYPVKPEYIVDVIKCDDLFGKFNDDDFDALYENKNLY